MTKNRTSGEKSTPPTTGTTLLMGFKKGSVAFTIKSLNLLWAFGIQEIIALANKRRVRAFAIRSMMSLNKNFIYYTVK